MSGGGRRCSDCHPTLSLKAICPTYLPHLPLALSSRKQCAFPSIAEFPASGDLGNGWGNPPISPHLTHTVPPAGSVAWRFLRGCSMPLPACSLSHPRPNGTTSCSTHYHTPDPCPTCRFSRLALSSRILRASASMVAISPSSHRFMVGVSHSASGTNSRRLVSGVTRSM